MNQYIAIGNLTKNPIHVVGKDNTYCNFTIAVNNRNNDTSFVEVATYGKQADACKAHLAKGSLVCVKGVPVVRAYLDKDDKPRAVIKVRVREIDFLNKLKPKAENN